MVPTLIDRTNASALLSMWSLGCFPLTLHESRILTECVSAHQRRRPLPPNQLREIRRIFSLV